MLRVVVFGYPTGKRVIGRYILGMVWVGIMMLVLHVKQFVRSYLGGGVRGLMTLMLHLKQFVSKFAGAQKADHCWKNTKTWLPASVRSWQHRTRSKTVSR